MEGTKKIPPKLKVKKNLRYREKIKEQKPEEKSRGKTEESKLQPSSCKDVKSKNVKTQQRL